MAVMSSSERFPRAWKSSLKLVHLFSLLLLFDSWHFFVENVEKGPNDRPKVDVIIAECGEVRVFMDIYLSSYWQRDPFQLPVEVLVHAEL